MRNHIKLYEEYTQDDSQFFQTKEEITNWLYKFKIERYSINNDLTVDVTVGSVRMVGKELNNIPVKFKMVRCGFVIAHNNLKNLKGCPISVGCNFGCGNNELTSLEGCPRFIRESLYCSNNKLTSLVFAPKKPSDYSNNPCSEIYDRLGFTAEAHIESLLTLDPNPKYTMDRLREINHEMYFDLISKSPELCERIGVEKGLDTAYQISKDVEGDFY